MASRTRLELIHKVIDNLGVLVPGQSPSAEDVGKVDNVLDAVMASLAAREILFVGDLGTATPPAGGEIDETVFLGAADILADRCAPMFNMAGDAQLKALAIQAEDELRIIGRPPKTRRVLQCDAGVRTQHMRGVGNFTTGT
jgi:hypothetical protein